MRTKDSESSSDAFQKNITGLGRLSEENYGNHTILMSPANLNQFHPKQMSGCVCRWVLT
jgi:hypothetical protein